MSADRSLRFEGASAAFTQLTQQLQKEEAKLLQVCILHDMTDTCVAYHKVLRRCCHAFLLETCLALFCYVQSSGQLVAAQAQAAVDKRAEELNQQAEALAQEKQTMSAVGVADNDVLDLNVGGVTLSVKRATLTQVNCLSTSVLQKLFCTTFTLMVL